MLRVYLCLTEHHDDRMVALAFVVAALGCQAMFSLLRHARAGHGDAKHWWLMAAALTAGSTFWATHFIAGLAFDPGTSTDYTPGLTALSFAVGTVGMALALATAMHLSRPLGGVLAGLVIAVMHNLGMAAFRLGGIVVLDRSLVVASVLAGVGLATAAFVVGDGVPGRWRHFAAALLLTLAVGGLHFIGIAAVAVVPDGSLAVPQAGLPPVVVAVLVALGCLVILGLGALALLLERRHARRGALELGRMHDLADATVEGLLVCDGEIVVTANRSFAGLIGWPAETLTGMLANDLVTRAVPDDGRERDGDLTEGSVMSPSGDPIPVEMVTRTVNYGGRPHRVIACRDLRARRMAEARARFLARHEAVTGLPNRAKFMERLARAMAGSTGRRVTVLALDIDRFKAVNDALGHAQGDALLREVAMRLRGLIGETDLVAGFGGDEFAIFSTVAAEPAEAARLAQRLAAALAVPFSIAGEPVSLTVSLGIALSDPAADGAETLLQHADLALQRAKRGGGNLHCFFEPAMDRSVQQARSLELDLRAAVGRDELEVWFQPQLTLGRDQLAGFEALLRWRHPHRGLIAPGAFIPLAEESGLITPIGAQVLRTAMATAQSWPGRLSIAVNLSPVQLRSPELFGTVTAALEATGLDPSRLELEVTESVLLDGDPALMRVLHRLRTLGIRMALDDFGTGFSSLSYLRSFPFDKLKIDRSFVGEVTAIHECRAIVRAIIGLGRDLNITTTAEGVETEAQLEFLRQEGCDEVQGYLLGRPMPTEAARDMILASTVVAA